MKIMLTGALLALLTLNVTAQQERWQQEVDYEMDIVVDTQKHQYTGSQKLVYRNNSPEQLDQVFYHLFFNAFQPGSMMDVRSRTIEDPDSRVGDRIYNLQPDEFGYIRPQTLIMNGKACDFKIQGTILEVTLPSPIKPGGKATFEMTWEAQVPLQIRRSGWNNKEGVEFSMTQWYPKMCEYDYEGWHANPYIGREFYGVWGDFCVNITIDKDYLVGGTGVLQNPKQIGHGYIDESQVKRKEMDGKLTWKFEAEDVHDFAWAADPDFKHTTAKLDNGTVMHFIYEDEAELAENWEKLPEFTVKAFAYMNERFGEYPYPQYSVIQGGDGGMEYPMCTLITGERSLPSLVGVTVHEGAHSWYHGVLGFNESLHEWMDEGFTSFATSETMARLFPNPDQGDPHGRAYSSYINQALSGKEEALITHADHYNTNRAYGVGAYSKGETLLAQLGYVMGNDTRDQALKVFFETWKFQHPNPNDFKRIMEIESGLELDWYFQYFQHSTKQIDYRIAEIRGDASNVSIVLERVGQMPMPQDVLVTFNDGTTTLYHIPLVMMRGEKQGENLTVLPDWPWVEFRYEINFDRPATEIESVFIDPQAQMADVDRANNLYIADENTPFLWRPAAPKE